MTTPFDFDENSNNITKKNNFSEKNCFVGDEPQNPYISDDEDQKNVKENAYYRYRSEDVYNIHNQVYQIETQPQIDYYSQYNYMTGNEFQKNIQNLANEASNDQPVNLEPSRTSKIDEFKSRYS
jgi:hypothetical protein